LPGLDLQATWYSIKINGVLLAFNNPTSNSFGAPAEGFHYIVPNDLAGLSNGAGCAGSNATPTNCAPFEQMVTAISTEFPKRRRLACSPDAGLLDQ